MPYEQALSRSRGRSVQYINNGGSVNTDERLDRIEKVVLATAEQQAWMIQWIDSKFAQVDKQFVEVRQEVGEVRQETMDTRTYIDLKFESIRSDFRIFRETYLDLSARVKALEARC